MRDMPAHQGLKRLMALLSLLRFAAEVPARKVRDGASAAYELPIAGGRLQGRWRVHLRVEVVAGHPGLAVSGLA